MEDIRGRLEGRMGRVKGQAIKRTTRKLLQDYHDLFSQDYEKNKLILEKILETGKRNRNSIAGYMSRILKRETKK